MNSEICFDACRNIYGKSSSTFWGIFIKIPKLIPRVATLVTIPPLLREPSAPNQGKADFFSFSSFFSLKI